MRRRVNLRRCRRSQGSVLNYCLLILFKINIKKGEKYQILSNHPKIFFRQFIASKGFLRVILLIALTISTFVL